MPLTGEAKKIYQREYMRLKRSNKGVCQACGSKDYIQAHHPDYTKPLEVLWVCASCHKKLHLCLAGNQRTTSNPYINPLDKIARKQPKPIIDAISPSIKREGYGKASSTVITELDADGNPIPEY